MERQDDMQAGSFRGVPFQAKRHNQKGGLQGAHHSYPERDKGFVEHMGQKDSKLSLDIVLLGPEYMAGRDALIKALLKPGPGELVHPWLGRMTVSLDPGSDFSQGETVDELGMCKFTVAFIRAGGTAGPRVRNDTRRQLQAQVSNARATVKSDFAATVHTRRVSAFVTESLAVDVGTLQTTLKDLTAGAGLPDVRAELLKEIDISGDPGLLADKISGLLEMPDFPIDPLDLSALAGKTLGSIERLKYLPLSKISGLLKIRNIITGSSAFPKQVMSAIEQLKSLPALLKPVISKSGTPSRKIEANNRAAFTRLASGQAALTFTEAASTAEFESHAEAIDALERGTQMLDTAILEAADAGADPVYEALEITRANLIEHIQATAGDLGRLVSIRLNRPQPSVLLSYDLYDDISRADEIARRNIVANPNRLPAAKDLEVLNV